MYQMKSNLYGLILKMSLKKRLLFTYLLLSLLILAATSVAFYQSSKKVLIKQATISSQQQLSLITNNLREKIGHISDYAITLSISSSIAEILKNNPIVPDNELNKFFVNSEFIDQTQRIIGLHKNIYAWDFLDTNNQWFHSSTTDTDQLTSCFSEDFLNSLPENLSLHFLGPYNIDGKPVFAVLKSITNIDNTKYLGALVLLVKETNISSTFNNLPDSDSKNFYIIDKNNQILSSSSSLGIYKTLDEYLGIHKSEINYLKKDGTRIINVNGTDNLFISKSYDDLDWDVINIIPLKNLTMDHIAILYNIFVISLFLFLLSVVFSMLCSQTVASPIQRLAAQMEKVSLGDLDISVTYHSNDEISILYEQFNIMMNQIQKLLANIYEEQTAKRKMEIQLLQSQINPHFLYNTLNTINSLIELDMNKTASNAVSAMSSFYRNCLSKGEFIIPLKQEIIITRQYLYIQNLRYMEFIDYKIIEKISEEDSCTMIPKLTIQPIVENIFVHALGTNKCRITIEIVLSSPEQICISIADNGRGIPPEKLEQLKQFITDGRENGKSFGLPSIKNRIALLYGNNYSFTIESTLNEGTKIIILIPRGEREK